MVRSSARRATSLAQRFTASQSRTMTRSRTPTTSGTVTFQRDGVTRYVKHRMPGRMRRRWRSFVRRVQHVNMASGPCRTFTRDSAGQSAWSINEQTFFGYICGGTTTSGNDELRQVFYDAYGTAVVTPPSSINQRKLFIKSVVMDVQIRNIGSQPIVLDAYTIRCRRGWSVADDLAYQFGTTFSEQIASASGTANALNPAVTPFQNSHFLKYWSVVKKQELIVGGGNTATFQIRLPTNRMIQGKEFDTEPNALPRYSHALFFMPRGSPELNIDGVNGQLAAGQVVHAVQWTVCYQYPPSAGTQDATRQV